MICPVLLCVASNICFLQLQRIGRTGRKKDGHIAVLVAEGKEESNFDKAKDAYSTVQQNILKGNLIELYTDVPRLLPPDAQPQPHEMVMPIVSYVRDVVGTKGSKVVGSIEQYVTKTRPSKEPKMTAKTRIKLRADLAVILKSETDDSDELSLDITKPMKRSSKTSKHKPTSEKAKLTSKNRKKSEGQASGRQVSDETASITSKKSKKRKSTIPRLNDDDEGSPLKVPKKKRPGKERVDKSQSTDDDESEPQRSKGGKKASAKKRSYSDASPSSDSNPPSPKRKKRRSPPTKSSSDKSPPPFAQVPTVGFVTARGKQLLPNTNQSFAPPIDISDDDEPPHIASPMKLDSLASNPNQIETKKSDISVGKPISYNIQSLSSSPEASSSKPANPPQANISPPSLRAMYSSSPPLSPPPQARSQRKSSIYSPEWNISLPSSSKFSPIPGPSTVAHSHDWLLDSDSDDEPVVVKSTGRLDAIPTQVGPERVRSGVLSSHIAASPMLKRSHGHKPPNTSSFTASLMSSMGPPRSAHRRPSIVDLADSSIELIPSSSQKRDLSGYGSLGNNSKRPSQHVDISDDDSVSFEDTSFAKYLVPAAGGPDQSSSPIRRSRGIKRGRKSKGPGMLVSLSSDDAAEDEDEPELDDAASSEHGSPAIPSEYRHKNKHKKRKRPVFDRNNAFVAMEADLSGDDVAGGSTDTEGEEDQYDKDFIADGDITQPSDDYDQSAIYRQGLMTQAPAGLNFANKPVRNGVFGTAFELGIQRQVHGQLSSSPPRPPDSEDGYEFGSFVVDDDE